MSNRGCLHCLIPRYVSVVFPYHVTWSHATLCASVSVSFPDHVPQLHSHSMQLSLIPRPNTTMRLSHMMREQILITSWRNRVPSSMQSMAGVATLVPIMINGVWNAETNYSEIRAFTGQHSLLAWQYVSHMVFWYNIDDNSIFVMSLKGQKPPGFMIPLGCYGCYGYW